MCVCVLMWLLSICFFCFKQKTAYELRISDWSSDVCSSDLRNAFEAVVAVIIALADLIDFEPTDEKLAVQQRHILFEAANADLRPLPVFAIDLNPGKALQRFGDILRSEEHTSELQSLMRISYAVFCLKKKNKLNLA